MENVMIFQHRPVTRNYQEEDDKVQLQSLKHMTRTVWLHCSRPASWL